MTTKLIIIIVGAVIIKTRWDMEKRKGDILGKYGIRSKGGNWFCLDSGDYGIDIVVDIELAEKVERDITEIAYEILMKIVRYFYWLEADKAS